MREFPYTLTPVDEEPFDKYERNAVRRAVRGHYPNEPWPKAYDFDPDPGTPIRPGSPAWPSGNPRTQFSIPTRLAGDVPTPDTQPDIQPGGDGQPTRITVRPDYGDTGLARFREARGLNPLTEMPESDPTKIAKQGYGFPEYMAQQTLGGIGELVLRPRKAYREGLTPEEEIATGGAVMMSQLPLKMPGRGRLGIGGGKIVQPEIPQRQPEGGAGATEARPQVREGNEPARALRESFGVPTPTAEGRIPASYRRTGAADDRPRDIDQAKVVAQYDPDPVAVESIAKPAGIDMPVFHELHPESADAFHKAISDMKAAHPSGMAVDVYSPQDYAGMRTFTTPDAKMGFAIKPDGNIVSVFKHPDAKYKSGTVGMLEAAVAQGGRKLDAFDTVLPRLYGKSGFRVVARTPFDPASFDQQFLLPQFYEQFKNFNNGRPDVVFMVFDPKHRHDYRPGEGPSVSYDQAVALQDKAVAEIGQRHGIGPKLTPVDHDPFARKQTAEEFPYEELSRDAFKRGVTTYLEPHGENRFLLSELERTTGKKGAGADVMQNIIDTADKHGVTLEVAAGVPKLEAYYKRFGFTPTKSDPYYTTMERPPAGGKKDIPTASGTVTRGHNQPPELLEESRISTRFPTAKIATEDPLKDKLTIGMPEMTADPEFVAHNARHIRQYRLMPEKEIEGLTDAQLTEKYVEHMKNNLLWLHDHPDIADWRDRASRWYDGGRRLVDDMSSQYGIHPHSAAGAMAALSPQNPWFNNVSHAFRVADIVTNKQNTKWSPEMEATAKKIFPEDKVDKNGEHVYRDDIRAIKGKKFSELTLPIQKAMWVRTYDEAHNPRSHHVISPEGDKMGFEKTESGKDAMTQWFGLSGIAKAIQAIEAKGDLNKISPLMGDAHKVRNFYNNLIHPNSPSGDVTIDTHAVGAAHLKPMSVNSAEVIQNFGSGMTNKNKAKQPAHLLPYIGGKSSAITGVAGTYGLQAEAYRRAAVARGILPRQMQSITWEAVRSLFPREEKKTGGFRAKADEIWHKHNRGEILADEAREQIYQATGGKIQAPDWHQGLNR